MMDHSQAMTASWLCLLPRIVPAPQTLLKPSRPLRLPPTNAFVVGVYNGIFVETLNYFSSILHPIEELPAYGFRVYTIKHRTPALLGVKQATAETPSVTEEHASKEALSGDVEVETGRVASMLLPKRRTTFQHFRQQLSFNSQRPRIHTRLTSPLNLLSIFSFCVTIALFALAIVKKDGTALVALCTISVVSSLVGLASKWSPVLRTRSSKKNVPDGDVVVRTRQGALLVVHCDEAVARELYSGSEECTYNIETTLYRVLVGFGTFFLMVSIVLLGNCKFPMQLAVGVAYIVLNGLFWAAALFNKRLLWDLSNYDIVDTTPAVAEHAHMKTGDHSEGDPSFTRTLWYAIRETRRIGWVKRGGVAPPTTEWEEWLKLAEENAEQGNVDWPAVLAKDQIFGRREHYGRVDRPTASTEGLNQKVPALEVPAPTSK